MDFHTLARKDLQALCKKNKIPANMTNMAMADALKRLQHVEGIDELLKPIDSEILLSPEKPVVASPQIPRTLSKASTRRKPVKEDPASSQPLTRTRRGTRRTAGEEPEEAKTEVPETPAAPSSRKGAPVTSTRGKVGSREANQEESAAQQPVYSTRRSIRFTEKKLADLTLNAERRGRRKPIKIDDLSKEGSKRSLHSDGDEDNKDSHAVSDEDQDKADEFDVVSAGKSSGLFENANDLNDGDEVNSETNGNRADDFKGKPEEGLVVVDGSDVVSGSDQNSTKLIEKERDVEDQVHDENKETYFGTNPEVGCDELNDCSEKAMVTNVNTTDEDGSDELDVHSEKPIGMNDETTEKDDSNDVSCNITELGFQDFERNDETTEKDGPNDFSCNITELVDTRPQSSLPQGLDNSATEKPELDSLGSSASADHVRSNDSSMNPADDQLGFHGSDDLYGGSQMVSLNQLESKKEPEIPECQPVEDFAHLGQSTDSDMILAEDLHDTQVPESKVVSEEESSGKVLDENSSNTEEIDAADDLPEVQTVCPDPGEDKSSEHKEDFDMDLAGEETYGKIVDEKSSETQGSTREDGVPEVGMVCSEHLANLKENEVLEVKADGELLVEKSFEIQESSRAGVTEEGMVCSEQLASFKETETSESSAVLVEKSFEIQESSCAGVTEDGMVCSEQLGSFKETEISESSKVLVEKSFEIQESSHTGFTEISESSKVLVEKSFEIQESSNAGVTEGGMVCSEQLASFKETEISESSKILVEIDGKLLDEKTIEIQERSSADGVPDKSNDSHMNMEFNEEEIDGKLLDEKTIEIQESSGDDNPQNSMQDFEVTESKDATDELGSDKSVFVQSELRAAVGFSNEEGVKFLEKCNYEARGVADEKIEREKVADECPQPLVKPPSSPLSLVSDAYEAAAEQLAKQGSPSPMDNIHTSAKQVSPVISHANATGEIPYSSWAVDPLLGHVPRPTQLTPTEPSTKSQTTVPKIMPLVSDNKENIGHGASKVELRKEKEEKKVITEDKSLHEKSLRQLTKLFKEQLRIKQQVGKRPALQKVEENRLATEKTGSDGFKVKLSKKKRDMGKDNADGDNSKQLQSLRKMKRKDNVDNEKSKPLQKKRDLGKDNADDDKLKQLQSLRQLRVQERKMKRNRDNVDDETLKPLQKKRDLGKDNADDDKSKQLQSLRQLKVEIRKMKRNIRDNVDNETLKPLQKKRETEKDNVDDDKSKQLQSLRQLKVKVRKMKRNIRKGNVVNENLKPLQKKREMGKDNVDDDKSKQLQSLRQLKVKVRKMKRNIRKGNVVNENLKPLQKKSLRQLSKLLKEKIQNQAAGLAESEGEPFGGGEQAKKNCTYHRK